MHLAFSPRCLINGSDKEETLGYIYIYIHIHEIFLNPHKKLNKLLKILYISSLKKHRDPS